MKTKMASKRVVLVILCLLLVFAQTGALATVRVTSVSINKSSATIYNTTLARITHTVQLRATVYPSSATVKGVKWTSSNTSVATVSTGGLVTAKGTGTAVIKATAKDSRWKYATCTVRVNYCSNKLKVQYYITPYSDTVYNSLKDKFTSRSDGLKKLNTAMNALKQLQTFRPVFSFLYTQRYRVNNMYTTCQNAYTRLSKNSNPSDTTLRNYIVSMMNDLKTFKTYCASFR